MGPRILIVDDIPGYIDVLEMYLPPDAQVAKAGSLAEARKQVAELQIDLAIVDIRLSEEDPMNRDGLEFLRWTRTHAPQLPVIMVSAYHEFEYETESLACGAKCFLHKPVNPRQLSGAVEEALAPGGEQNGDGTAGTGGTSA